MHATAPVQPSSDVPRAGAWLESALVFVLVAVPGALLAAYLALSAHVYEGDAISRVYQAVAVLFPGPPRLGHLSFVWTPLPTLLQLPLVGLRPLAREGLSAQVVSVASAAGALVVLNRLLRPLLPDRAWRFGFLALYQLHPLVLVYTLNGMTESTLVLAVLMGMLGLTNLWRAAQRAQGTQTPVHDVILMGVAAALAFLTRYEGVAFGLVLGAALLIVCYQPGRQGAERMEGLLLGYAAPWAYAIGLWLAMNWLIMSDPLNFLVGRGSNRDLAAAMLAGDPLMASLRGNLGAALAYVGHVLLFVYPLFGPVMLALAGRGVARRDVYAVVLLLIGLSFPAQQVGLHDLGQSFGFARFSIYVISLSVLGGAYLMSQLRRARTVCGAALVLGMLVSAATAWLLPSQPDLRSNFEASYFRALTGQAARNPLAARYEMGLFLRNELSRRDPAARILADELATDAVIVFSGLFDNFVTTRDEQFAEDLADPAGRVDYLLASTRSDDRIKSKVSGLAERLVREGGRLDVVYQTTSAEPERLTLYRVLAIHS